MPTRFLVPLALVLAACGPGTPTEADLESAAEAQLASVVGGWTGLSVESGATVLTLDFTIVSSGGSGLRGTGTMRAGAAGAPVPITVQGSFARPQLTLVLDGLQVDGRAVRGTVAGRYVSAGGLAETLVLTAEGFERRVPILLQER